MLPWYMRALKCALLGGLIMGGIGFVGGFFGPLILTPDANQGPLLGIFITGPLGFMIGLLLGGLSSPFLLRKPPKLPAPK
jgi:preprotein translocase subunit Sss1